MKNLSNPGRILFLSQSSKVMRQQVGGENLAYSDALPLRDDVSTDEITPVAILSHYDNKLGRFACTGLRAGDDQPLARDAVLHGGFGVTVGGRRYGKGSSREHSPAAEQYAGIRLVIAESFERIYRQNADNIGLITTTQMGMVERLQRGETITVAELLDGRDALAAGILAEGGLLQFGQKHMKNVSSGQGLPTGKPQTLFEKIVSRHWLQTPVSKPQPSAGQGGFVRADWRFIHEYYTGMCAHMLHATFGQALALHERSSIIVFEDHTSYVSQSPAHLKAGLVPNVVAMRQAQRDFVKTYGLKQHRTLTDEEAARDNGSNVAGISHAMMAERYALPGQLIAGTDSHTSHCGALGCVAFGVGTTDMANAFVTGAVRITMPEVLRVEINGTLGRGVTAKDIVLHLLALPFIREGKGVGKVFEFSGAAVRGMSVDERATLTNMVAELGGFTGLVTPDATTVRFLRERRGVDFSVEPWMCSDEGAHYCDIIALDCTDVEPMIACPGDPGNGLALSQLASRVNIDIAYGGSCTAGKREDFDSYYEVLAWALSRGLSKPAHVSLYLQFGTTDVRDYCAAQGYLDVFKAAGAVMLQPSCGACANCGPGSSSEEKQVTVSAINRNFPGRSGPGQVWLASPPTVVASAMTGWLTSFDDLRATHGRDL